jgi:hypothetical protein
MISFKIYFVSHQILSFSDTSDIMKFLKAVMFSLLTTLEDFY